MKTSFLCLLSLSAVLRIDAFSFTTVATIAPRPRIFFNDRETIPLPPSIDNALVKTAAPQKTISKAKTYEEAIQIIDQCALQEEPCEELFQAVKFIERGASMNKIYPEASDKQELWNRAQGCWKLVLSTGDGKTRSFHPPSYAFPFSFAMISGEYFGNGFGLNEKMVWVSVLQKHYFNPNIRQMVVTVLDIYLGGRKATSFIPEFMKKAINLGKTPQDFAQDKERPPAFCLIAATDNALIARGNQSGAVAIWKKLSSDVRPIAYKGL